MSPQVFFPQPVVAVSVIIHFGSDGYTPVDTDTKYMRVDLLTPENRTVPVVPGNIPVKCRENPVLVPIKQDLSKPFFLTQGTYKFTGYNMYGVIFISSGTAIHFRLLSLFLEIIEPPRGKTNNLVSDQIRHKSVCAVTEKS